MDWFWGLVGLFILAIAFFIVRAVRITLGEVRRNAAARPGMDPRALADEIRSRRVPCPRCGGESFFLLATGNRYRCESCRREFEGPDHLDADGGNGGSATS